MDQLLIYTITAIFVIITIKLALTYVNNYIKYKKFIKKHFVEDRLYNIDELAGSFALDTPTMKNVLNMLQKAYVFRSLNDMGVSMDKDYFSKYEIKILVKMLVKKNKLL